MSANVLTLKESINNLLNSREQAEFVDVINEYQQQRNVVLFCNRLRTLFDTPAKTQLVSLIRKITPRTDLAVFEEVMASSLDTRTLPRTYGKQKQSKVKKGPGSTVSLPARLFNTLPAKGGTKKIVCRPALERSPDSRPVLPTWEPGIVSNVKKIYMEQVGTNNSLGFSIRGGAEHGIGIYVSYVDVDSVAERQGVVPGDQILSVNGLSFRKITHHEAVKLIKAHRALEIEVRNVGRVPGSFETHQTYTWVDPTGRTVSPPPEVDRTARYKDAGRRKSGLMLLKDTDERKVNLVVTDTRKLGIMIRGGNEFGLGIYITGVDRGSIVENGGLQVGDQILDVNGTSFLDISHNEAAKVLKSSRHLIVTVKDVGKLPYAKTTYDQTKWITGSNIPGRSRVSSFGSNSRGLPGMPDLNASSSSVFSRGAGSQLMHSSMVSQRSQWTLLEDQAKQLLNDNERATMNYYMSEYEHDNVSVSSLVLALLELFNTRAKISLMDDIRGLIAPRDLETFDGILIQRNALTMRSRSMDALMPFNDQLSENSMDTSSINNSQTSAVSSSNLDGDEMEPLREALSQICEDREIVWQNQTHKVESPISLQTTVPPPVPPKSYTTAEVHQVQVSAEIHPSYQQQQQHMKIRKLCEEDMRSPSEDSGVEVSALENSVSSGSQGHRAGRQRSHSYHGNGLSSTATSQPGYHGNHHIHYSPSSYNAHPTVNGNQGAQANHRVTMSTAEPVIINDVLRQKASNGLGYYHSDAESVRSRSTSQPDRPVMDSYLSPQSVPQYQARYPDPEQLSPLHGYHRHIESSTTPPPPPPPPLAPQAPQAGLPPAPQPGLTPEEDALRGFDEILGMPTTPQPSELSFANLLQHSRSTREEYSSFDQPLPPVEEPTHRDSLDLPPPPQFAGSRDNSPNRHLTSIQVQPLQSMETNSSVSYDYNHHHGDQRSPQNENLRERNNENVPGNTQHNVNYGRPINGHPEVVNGIPVAKLPSGPGFGSLRERVKSRRAVLETSENTGTYLLPKPSQPTDAGRQYNQEGQIKVIRIQKVRPTLGIAIEGGANTKQPLPRVINIQPSGCASASSGLKVGQQLLQVNGRPLTGLAHQDCAKTIAQVFKDRSVDHLEFTVLDTSMQLAV